MRERIIRNGIDSLQDHEALEVYLYSVFKRSDTNELAHRLIKHFGSLAGVYDASIGELLKVDGVGPAAAFHLHTMTGQYRKYAQSRGNDRIILDNHRRIAAYLHGCFKGRTTEAAYLLTLDAGYRQVLCVELNSGMIDHVDIDPQVVLDIVTRRRCRYAVLAHNHTSDVALYSPSDVLTTNNLGDMLRLVNVTLLDHLIFDESDYVSMEQSGVLRR